MKKFVMTLAAGAALAAASTAAFSQWAFDDPYWKRALDRSNEPTVFEQLAAAPGSTRTDAGIEFRLTDGGIASGNEAEKARLDAAGFPQYNN